MSKKIKGMFGSETRANEVLAWLKSQGAERCQYKGFVESNIYYVDQGEVKMVDIKHSILFDIVELPQWRAEKGSTYCYISELGFVTIAFDMGKENDDCRFECGNYFKTLEEAEPYAEKIREIFKERREK